MRSFRRSSNALCAAVCLALAAPGLAADVDLRLEAALTHDDNVSRALQSQRLSDDFLNLNLGVSGRLSLAERVQLAGSVQLGGDKFRRYEGLTRVFAGAGAEVQYRPSAGFGAPTFAAFVNGFVDRYDSDLRDGFRHDYGISMRLPLTDRIDFSAAIARNVRDGKSSVFDVRDYGARFNVDYLLTRAATLYAGAEYRRGDTVASGPPNLAFVNIAKAIVRDDVFGSPQRFAYRVEARTVLTTLGANVGLSEAHSFDLSWRWIQATPTDSPGFVAPEPIRYRVNQYTLGYLGRF